MFPTVDGYGRAFAYRLSGPLAAKVCGVHLTRGWRLAFTLREADRDGIDGVVDILFVGPRETRRRENDIWTVVHDLFGEENPPAGHRHPRYCQDGTPTIDIGEIAEYVDRLRRFLRD